MPSNPPRANSSAPRRAGVSRLQWVILIGLGLLSLATLGGLAVVLLVYFGNLSPRAIVVTAAVVQTAAPGPSPFRYPTLPPEWTATPAPPPSATRLPATPTGTSSPTASPTASATQTSKALYTFAGKSTVQNQSLSLPGGVFIVAWTYTGPANSQFSVVLGEVAGKHVINFVTGTGPKTGSSALEVKGGGTNFVLSVEASGPWQVTIRPKTGP